MMCFCFAPAMSVVYYMKIFIDDLSVLFVLLRMPLVLSTFRILISSSLSISIRLIIENMFHHLVIVNIFHHLLSRYL